MAHLLFGESATQSAVYFDYNPSELTEELIALALKNRAINQQDGYPYVVLSRAETPQNVNKTALIFGGGPSLKEQNSDGVVRLDEAQARPEDKILCGSAHRLLDEGTITNNVVACVYNMPHQVYAGTLKSAQNIQYWLTTTCHPDLVEKVKGKDVQMCDPLLVGVDNDDGASRIGLGSTAPSAAAALAILQGYNRLEFYGVDGGGFDIEPNIYDAYDMSDILAQQPVEALENNLLVELKDRGVMTVSASLWDQLLEMKRLQEANPSVEFVFHGENRLNNLILNQGVEIVDEIPALDVVDGLDRGPEN